MRLEFSSLKIQLFTLFIITHIAIGYGQQPITWTDLVNVSESNGDLTKKTDVKTWWNGGAASLETLSANNDGWVRSVVKETNTGRILGFSGMNTNAGWDTIEYGFYLKSRGGIEILESGKVILTAKVKYKKGDIVSVERIGSKINYKHNETIVYTSKKPHKGDLIVDVSMYSPKSTLQGVTISSSFSENKKNNASKPNTDIVLEASPDDYKISNSNIVIIKATPGVLQKINQLENKEKREIRLGKISSQEDFDLVCEKLTWIKKINIRDVKTITNVNSLKNLKALEEFYLSSFKFGKDNPFDLEVLKDAKKLRELDFSFVILKNTQALQNINSLEEVNFFSSGADDMSFLKNNPKVKDLDVSGYKHSFKDYGPIASLKMLEKLSLPETFSDQNAAVLGALSNLKYLELGGSDNIKSLKFIANSNDIITIKASSCINLEDIEALKGKTKLRSLDLYYCKKITSIAALEGLAKLDWLQLNATNISDLSPLKGAENLRFLDVADTKVVDISSLMNCKKMKNLEVGPGVPKNQIEEIKKAIPGIKVIVK